MHVPSIGDHNSLYGHPHEDHYSLGSIRGDHYSLASGGRGDRYSMYSQREYIKPVSITKEDLRGCGPSPPETVRVGSLVLGRGSVYQYPTKYYIDRRFLPSHFFKKLVLECIPCLENQVFPQPSIEASPGSAIHLKQYVEDVEQAVYDNRLIDAMEKRKLFRLCTSHTVVVVLLIMTFLLAAIKSVASISENDKNWMTLFETNLAVLAVIVRIMQTLALYWRERETRMALEVCAWEDGTITRGRPLALYIIMGIYIMTQILVCFAIVIGSLCFSALHQTEWTILTTGIPVFLISELMSNILQRTLDVWRAETIQDHLRLTLIEASDIFEEAWVKTRDCNIQNKMFSFKEAITNAFHLDTLRLAYIQKAEVQENMGARIT